MIAIQETRYLIIGGVYKSATTSLYHYLADHPSVCGSAIKEPRFFLDLDYPVPSPFRYDAGLDAYGRYFSMCRCGQLRLESAPFYLYSPGTAQRIKTALGSAQQMLFVLRDPIARLRSCFRSESASVQFGGSFDAYVAHWFEELEAAPDHRDANQIMMGNYSEYLPRYLDVFGQDAVKVVLFEDLVQRPRAILREVSSFAGIAPAFYDTYSFRVHNASLEAAFGGQTRLLRAFDRLRLKMTPITIRQPHFHASLRWLKQSVAHGLGPSARAAAKGGASPATLRELEQYYSFEFEALGRLLGRPLPWPWAAKVAQQPGTTASPAVDSSPGQAGSFQERRPMHSRELAPR